MSLLPPFQAGGSFFQTPTIPEQSYSDDMGAALSGGNSASNTIDNSVSKEIVSRAERKCQSVSCSNQVDIGTIFVGAGRSANIDVSQDCSLRAKCVFEDTFLQVNDLLLENASNQEADVKQPSPAFLQTHASINNKVKNNVDNSVFDSRVLETIEECGGDLVFNEVEIDDIIIEASKEPEGSPGSDVNLKIAQKGSVFYSCAMKKLTDIVDNVEQRNESDQTATTGEADPLTMFLAILGVVVVSSCILVSLASGAYAMNQTDQQGDPTASAIALRGMMPPQARAALAARSMLGR